MTFIPDQIHGALIQQSLSEARYEAHLQQQVLDMLQQLEASILAELNGSGLDTPRSDWQRARLRVLLADVEKVIAQGYQGISDFTDSELRQLAQVSQDTLSTSLNAAIGADLFEVQQWPPALLKTLATDVLIQGAPSAAWWERQSADLSQAFSDQMRQGLLRGESIGQLTQRVRGTGTVTGIMETSQRNAEALVRSSVISTANSAHLETYQQNSDIIQGLQWVSTLDMRTTPICQALDGMKWDLEFKPLDGALPFPGPTAHWGCRSTQVPLLKSWEQIARETGGNPEVAKQMDAMDRGTRASMNGQVSGDLTYQDWFKTLPKAQQEDILGPSRYALWKKGGMSFRGMVNMRGNPLTLDQLRARK